MGANKNSSRRMNSAYAPNSQPMVPTRVCQGRVVTTDLPTLGTNPNSKQHGSTTQEAKDLGDLHSLGWTFRVKVADCPRRPGGPSASTGRAVRKCHPNFQYCTLRNGLSAEHLRTVRASQTVRHPGRTFRRTPPNQKQLAKRIETRTRKNTRRTR
jgi:hypothetical protein